MELYLRDNMDSTALAKVDQLSPPSRRAFMTDLKKRFRDQFAALAATVPAPTFAPVLHGQPVQHLSLIHI